MSGKTNKLLAKQNKISKNTFTECHKTIWKFHNNWYYVSRQINWEDRDLFCTLPSTFRDIKDRWSCTDSHCYITQNNSAISVWKPFFGILKTTQSEV